LCEAPAAPAGGSAMRRARQQQSAVCSSSASLRRTLARLRWEQTPHEDGATDDICEWLNAITAPPPNYCFCCYLSSSLSIGPASATKKPASKQCENCLIGI
jgi:hypothetical protein